MRTVATAFRYSILIASLALGAMAGPAGAATASGVDPVPFGRPFPAATFDNLNVEAGGAQRIDLAAVLGKKPVVLFYWIAGNPRADDLFLELQALQGELGAEKLALYGVALQRPGRDADVIKTKLRELKISVPVLDDEGFRIGQQLRVQSVPNITILDAEGNLRLSNGALLSQDLEYNMTVETAIRRVAEKGSLGTYGYLARYYPVKELVGKKCPDFEAPLLSNGAVQSWHSMLSPDKVNVLIFWSIDCPHCRKLLPEVSQWLKENPDGVNVVSTAKVVNDAAKTKTREFCEANGIGFPTLVDQETGVGELFHVTSTPTTLIIRPDGVISAVLLSSIQDFGAAIEEAKRDLP
jgi:peroxiredoxin